MDRAEIERLLTMVALAGSSNDRAAYEWVRDRFVVAFEKLQNEREHVGKLSENG
jgi:hypothetical protein